MGADDRVLQQERPLEPDSCRPHDVDGPLKPLPNTENSLVLRTDFADALAWSDICSEIQRPVGEFRAYVECVSDPVYDGLQPDQLISASALGPYRGYVFVVDRTTFIHPENPILVVDLHSEPGRTFRVIPLENVGRREQLVAPEHGF